MSNKFVDPDYADIELRMIARLENEQPTPRLKSKLRSFVEMYGSDQTRLKRLRKSNHSKRRREA